MASWIPWALTILVAAQAGPDAKGPKAERKTRSGDMETFVHRVAKAVDATDEQVAALDRIVEEHQAAAAAMRADRQQLQESRGEEIDAIREQMREARQAGDEQKMKELRGQLRDMVGGQSQRELLRDTRRKIAAVLNTEQRIQFEEMVAGLEGRGKRQGPAREGPGRGQGGSPIYRFIRQLAEEVNATDDQRQQLRHIAADHVRAVKAAEAEAEIAREEGRERMGDLHRQVREARRDGNEDKARELQKQIRGMMGTPRREIVKETHDRIVEVLTAEQMPKFEAMKSDLRKTAGEPRGADRGNRQRNRGPRDGRRRPAPPPPPVEPVDEST